MAPLRSLFFENLTLKILSVFIAALLWFFVSVKSKTEMALSVPIEFTSIPADMAIISRVPTSVHIRVKGTKTLLRPLNSTPPSISVNLDKATTGKNIIRLSNQTFNDLPLGVDVVLLDPETLVLELDRFVKVNLPINIQTNGLPPKGYQIREIRIEPPKALIRASESYLQRHDTVFSEPLDVSQLRQTTKFEVKLLTPSEELKPVNPEIPIIATVEVEETLVQRVIKGIRIEFKNRDNENGRIGISNYFVDLVVECPLLMQVDDIRKEARISVDLGPLQEDLENGYYTFPVMAELPDKILLLSMDPAEIEIVFKKNTGGG
ncbi:MAG TPA: hypothetical protein ENN66_05475 [Proteobacteria bacterium]|nr:hypothetical protein [Pseudomonadota bacterium]